MMIICTATIRWNGSGRRTGCTRAPARSKRSATCATWARTGGSASATRSSTRPRRRHGGLVVVDGALARALVGGVVAGQHGEQRGGVLHAARDWAGVVERP